MQQLSKYKKTELGDIPEEWDQSYLLDFVESKNDIVAGPFGSNLKVSDYKNDGVPIIRLQNIERNEFINKNIKYISKEKAYELKYHSYKPHDIVLAKLGDPIGKTCIVPENVKGGIVVADVVRIRPSLKNSDTRFLEYALNSEYCSKQMNGSFIGTTRPRVNLDQIRYLKLLKPPLKEQQKIASILSNVDELIQKTDQIIEQTRILKKGLMQRLLTKGIGHTKFKKTELGEIPEDWNIKKFGEFSKTYRYPTFYGIQYRSEGVPVLNIGNIDSNSWKLSININDYQKIDKETSTRFERTIVHEGDLVLAVRGATIGKLALVPKDLSESNINANLLRISLDKLICNSTYFWFYCQTSKGKDDFREFVTSTAKETVQAGKLQSWKIPLPPLKEQQKISSILSNVEELIQKQQTDKSNLETLKKGLMQQLLTGKIRVKV